MSFIYQYLINLNHLKIYFYLLMRYTKRVLHNINNACSI